MFSKSGFVPDRKTLPDKSMMIQTPLDTFLDFLSSEEIIIIIIFVWITAARLLSKLESL